jgi:hypothetical protein
MLMIDGGRAVNAVPCESISEIVAAYGFLSPHPVLQIGLGLALLAIGLLPIPYFLDWFGRGGSIHAAEIWLIPVGVIGLSLLPGAFRRGYDLQVRPAAGMKRLAFRREAAPAGLAVVIFWLRGGFTTDPRRYAGYETASKPKTVFATASSTFIVAEVKMYIRSMNALIGRP